MRIASWDPSVFDGFGGIAYDRLLEASYAVKDKTVQKLRSQIGSRKTTGISRPPYKTGPYAGQAWTARNFGQLLQSVRVVEKKEFKNQEISSKIVGPGVNVRVYAGNYLAYYADIFEFYTAFMRPAFYESEDTIRSITGAE